MPVLRRGQAGSAALPTVDLKNEVTGANPQTHNSSCNPRTHTLLDAKDELRGR